MPKKDNFKKINVKSFKSPLPTGEATVLNTELLFSFKYYDEQDDKKYCLSNFDKEQVRATLERLREINKTTVNDLRQKRAFYHFHEVDWQSTTVKEGFTNISLRSLEPFQFSLKNVNGQKARIFGAMSQFTFYIVWFDLNHEIWPSFKRHT